MLKKSLFPLTLVVSLLACGGSNQTPSESASPVLPQTISSSLPITISTPSAVPVATPSVSPSPTFEPVPTVYRVESAALDITCSDLPIRVMSGPDVNADGMLNQSEQVNSQYLCGAGQVDSSLVSASALAVSDFCPALSHRVNIGEDTDLNGELDVNEIRYSAYICESKSLFSDINKPVVGPLFVAQSGDVLSEYTIVNHAASGELTMNDAGSFRYLPVDNFIGQVHFSIGFFSPKFSVEYAYSVSVSDFASGPVLAITPASRLQAVVEQNQTSTQVFTLTNPGAKMLNYALSFSADGVGTRVAEDWLNWPGRVGDGGNSKQRSQSQYRQHKKGEVDLRSGSPVVVSEAGPDAAGYAWRDSHASNGPKYDWLDISATGTILLLPFDDAVSEAVPIGFDFPFYDGRYSELYVSSNGFVTFEPFSLDGCCSGQPIPHADSINSIIAWAWADLQFYSASVFYQYFEDDKLVIQFQNVGEFGYEDTRIDAQIFLYTSGDILLQYAKVEGGIAERPASIGIENADGSVGLQVAFNTPYLQESLAVKFYKRQAPAWISSVAPLEGQIAPGEAQLITLQLSANQDVGDYAKFIDISHNGSNSEARRYPLALTITPDITPPVAISGLGVEDISHSSVSVGWAAMADSNGTGRELAGYELRYSEQPITDEVWKTAKVVDDLALPRSAGLAESRVVKALSAETTYYFAIKAIDKAGNRSALSNVVIATTLAAPEAVVSSRAIQLSLEEGATGKGEVVISNTGLTPLTYQLRLQNPESARQANLAAGANKRLLRKSLASRVQRAQVIADLPVVGSYVENELLVHVKHGASASALSTLALQNGATIKKQIQPLNIQLWLVDGSRSLLDVMHDIVQHPQVEHVELNYTVHSSAAPSDPRFDELWGLHNFGQTTGSEDADIDAIEAWQITTGASDVVIAVIDTGIDYTHPDLTPNMWRNTAEIPNNGIDDDENGFVDDVYGYDFTNLDGDPMDDNSHGTHVAGTIGAVGDNGVGVTGINHATQLMALKFLSAEGFGALDQAVAAIIYGVDNGADILNNSWGGGQYSEALKSAIRYANDHNVLFIVAAGNGATNNDLIPSYPANYDIANVVAVAATDHNDNLAVFSQYGEQTVHLAAPGVDILSTTPNENYQIFSGTSMASPHVAGAAGLLMGYNTSLNIDEIKQTLIQSVDRIDDLNTRTIAGGRLNVHQALLLAGPGWVSLPTERVGEVAAGGRVTITLDFKALGLSPGDYLTELQIMTNDTLNPEFIIPVNLSVSADSIAPSAVNDLVVEAPTEQSANLHFTASGDDGGEGKAAAYDVRYSTQALNEGNWHQAQKLSDLPPPRVAGSEEHIRIHGLPSGSDLWLGVKVVDIGGLSSALSNTVQVTTLSADLSVSPRVVPIVSLYPGEQSTRVLRFANEASADLKISISQVSGEETVPSGTRTARYLSVRDFAKGEPDTRRGTPVLYSAGGPDKFGYRWQDSHSATGPVFAWQDISRTGTLVTGLTDDSMVGPIDIGFDFPFYNTAEQVFYLSSNGFLTFNQNSDSGCCSGQPIPRNDAINHIIAWLWFDLDPLTATIYTQQVDAETFVLQFNGYTPFYLSDNIDMQVILKKSGQIRFQYKSFEGLNVYHHASIGIENEDGSDGLQVSFATDYIQEQLAVQISPPWLMLSEYEFDLRPAETQNVNLIFSAARKPGVYASEIHIHSNDENEPRISVPITLEIKAPE